MLLSARTESDLFSIRRILWLFGELTLDRHTINSGMASRQDRHGDRIMFATMMMMATAASQCAMARRTHYTPYISHYRKLSYHMNIVCDDCVYGTIFECSMMYTFSSLYLCLPVCPYTCIPNGDGRKRVAKGVRLCECVCKLNNLAEIAFRDGRWIGTLWPKSTEHVYLGASNEEFSKCRARRKAGDGRHGRITS